MNMTEASMFGCAGEVEGNFPRLEALIYMIFLFSQLVLSTFGNTLVCVAILRFRHLKTLTNTFIFSLAITDILTPFVRILYIAVAMIKNRWVFGCVWCKMSSVLGVFLCAASILHLCAISIERLVVIRWPLRHTQLITKRRVSIAVAAIWITALLLSLFPYFGFVEMSFNPHLLDCEIFWGHKPFLALMLLVCFFILPFLTMSGTYYFIFKEVHKQTRRISIITGTKGHKARKSSRSRRNATIRQELKAVKTVIVVIGVFFVLWLPFFVATSIRAYLPDAVPPSWQRVVLGLAYFNSSCNWVIYSVMNREIREAFKKLIITCKHSPMDTLNFERSTTRRLSKPGAFILQYFRRNSEVGNNNIESQFGTSTPCVISNNMKTEKLHIGNTSEVQDTRTVTTPTPYENSPPSLSNGRLLAVDDTKSLQFDERKSHPISDETLHLPNGHIQTIKQERDIDSQDKEIGQVHEGFESYKANMEERFLENEQPLCLNGINSLSMIEHNKDTLMTERNKAVSFRSPSIERNTSDKPSL